MDNDILYDHIYMYTYIRTFKHKHTLEDRVVDDIRSRIRWIQASRWTWHWCVRLWGLFKAASSPKEDTERWTGGEKKKMIPHSEGYHVIWHYHGKYLINFDHIWWYHGSMHDSSYIDPRRLDKIVPRLWMWYHTICAEIYWVNHEQPWSVQSTVTYLEHENGKGRGWMVMTSCSNAPSLCCSIQHC